MRGYRQVSAKEARKIARRYGVKLPRMGYEVALGGGLWLGSTGHAQFGWVATPASQPYLVTCPGECAASCPCREPAPKVRQAEYLDAFFEGYTECAKWCGIEAETPNRDEAKEMDITTRSLASMRKDCVAFVRANWADLLTDLADGHFSAGHHGHDFWLTRNRHGAGFWENPGAHNQRLSDAAKAYGDSGLHVHRGKLHVYPA